MADLFIVQVRLKFTLKLTAAGALLGVFATWWFWSQLEYEVDNHKFLFSAILTGALSIAFLGLALFYFIAKHTLAPGFTLSDRIDALPWWIVKMLLMVLLIAAGWFLIAHYSGRAADAFDLLADRRLAALEERIRENPETLAKRDPETGATLVQTAFYLNRPDAVAMLLANGASGLDLDPEGRDPLVLSFHDPAMLESLLEGGFDANHPGVDGVPALHHAVVMGATNALETLLRAGADIDAPDRATRTPLMAAVERDDLVMAGILIDRGAKLEAVDRRGDTALHKAVRRGSVETSGFLLERGADPTLFNFAHMTPSHLAVAAGAAPLVARLLKSPGTVDLVDDKETSPLDLALKERKFDIAELLIDAGADINRARANGDTLLRSAVLDRDYRAARFLIGQGAVAEIPNAEGQTALDLIQEKELTSLLDALDARK